MAVIATFLIWVGTEAAKAGGKAIAGAVVSKLVDIPVNAALGVEIQGITVEQWGERGKMVVLAAFTLGKAVPEKDFETKVKERFGELQKQVDGLKQDIRDLQKEVADFKWQVKTQFDKADEEKIWKSLLALDNKLDSFYEEIGELTKSSKPLAERRTTALDLSRRIVSTLRPEVMNTRDAFHGGVVEDVTVRGFLEIWQGQALRDADQGWNGERLARIYTLLEAKFTRAMLVQIRCARLMMEAYEALHADDSAQLSGVDYFVEKFYPVLKSEVDGFRQIIESLAVNLIPLPTGMLLPLNIPDEIAGMLARLDMFTAQALMGKTSDGQAPAATGGRQLPGVPALAGCWGRVVVPGSRWIRRGKGSKEEARVTLTDKGGRTATLKGTLEVRAVKYLPYENDKKVTLHRGYQIQVGTEPRDMDEMLVAHFTPSDVLPPDFSGEVSVKLEDQSGGLLAQTQAFVVPAPLDAAGQSFAPYGTFMMGFTGGAGIRAR